MFWHNFYLFEAVGRGGIEHKLDYLADRQIDRYFIDKKEVITDLFVIEMIEIYV